MDSEIQVQVSWHDDALIEEGMRTGCGYVPLMARLCAQARDAATALQMEKRQGVYLLASPNSDEHDACRFAEYLSRNPLVRETVIRIDSPSERQLEHLVTDAALYHPMEELKSKWHSDDIEAHRADPYWHESIGSALAEFMTPSPDVFGGLQFYHARDLAVRINPFRRPGCIVATGGMRSEAYSRLLEQLPAPRERSVQLTFKKPRELPSGSQQAHAICA